MHSHYVWFSVSLLLLGLSPSVQANQWKEPAIERNLSRDIRPLPLENSEANLLGQEEGPIVDTLLTLPPSADIPEEILRTEIITQARSPLNGKPLLPAEYAQLQHQLRAPSSTPLIDSNIRHLVFLLQLRQIVLPILP